MSEHEEMVFRMRSFRSIREEEDMTPPDVTPPSDIIYPEWMMGYEIPEPIPNQTEEKAEEKTSQEKDLGLAAEKDLGFAPEKEAPKPNRNYRKKEEKKSKNFKKSPKTEEPEVYPYVIEEKLSSPYYKSISPFKNKN